MSQIRVNAHRCCGFEIFPLPLDEKQIGSIDFDCGYSDNSPAFYRFEFTADEACDTFLDTEGFGKGCAFINGFNLGRFWEIEPQKRLYIPAPLIRKGKNVIVLFESEGKSGNSVRLFDEHRLF